MLNKQILLLHIDMIILLLTLPLNYNDRLDGLELASGKTYKGFWLLECQAVSHPPFPPTMQ